jgi:hypothetical protein
MMLSAKIKLRMHGHLGLALAVKLLLGSRKRVCDVDLPNVEWLFVSLTR